MAVAKWRYWNNGRSVNRGSSKIQRINSSKIQRINSPSLKGSIKQCLRDCAGVAGGDEVQSENRGI